MLILSRKLNESIVIDGRIIVKILRIDRDTVKLGIQAPAEVAVSLESEPPGATELVKHPRVIATPHIGAQTAEAQARAAEDIAREVLAALRGQPLRWKIA